MRIYEIALVNQVICDLVNVRRFDGKAQSSEDPVSSRGFPSSQFRVGLLFT